MGAKKIVEIYTLPKCTYCGPVKELMKKNGIDYLEYDVMRNHEARKKLLDVYGVKSVPLTVFNDGEKVVSGFKEDELRDGIRIITDNNIENGKNKD